MNDTTPEIRHPALRSLPVVQTVQNVNEALPKALELVSKFGYAEDSRNGKAYVVPGLLVTAYTEPQLKVLWSPERDCNPFFHFFESLWMLAGRNDVAFPAHFAANMRSFSVDGYTFNAAYGARWRNWAVGEDDTLDQLLEVIRKLASSPGTRQAVINIWDPSLDLVDRESNSKDRACNLNVVFTPRRVFNNRYTLDMTVSNRSNDLVWGAYGANAVHFATLHEFVAHAVDMDVGTYYQVSSNSHVYGRELYGAKLWDSLTEPTSDTDCYIHGWKHRLGVSDDYNLPPEIAAQNLGSACWLPVSRGEINPDEKTPRDSGKVVYRAKRILREVETFVSRALQAVQELNSELPTRESWADTNKVKNVLAGALSMSVFGPYLPVQIAALAMPMLAAHTAYKRGFHQEALNLLEDADTNITHYWKESSLLPKVSNQEKRIPAPETTQRQFYNINNDWLRACSQWIGRRMPPL